MLYFASEVNFFFGATGSIGCRLLRFGKCTSEGLPFLSSRSLMTSYNTNLASEFFVLSTLHRLGFDATLTLANKKSIDIVVVQKGGGTVSVDVKGLAGTTGFPIDNLKAGKTARFIVFVCYKNRIENPTFTPETFVVPSTQLKPLIYNAPGGRKLVRYSALRDKGAKYRDAWRLLKRTRM